VTSGGTAVPTLPSRTTAAGASHVWHRPVATDIEVDALRWAWQEVIDRTEALRTSYVWHEQALCRGVQDQAPSRFGLVEFASGDDDIALWDHAVRALAGWHFSLATPPLARAVLLRIGDRAELFLCAHSIAVDPPTGSRIIDDVLNLAKSWAPPDGTRAVTPVAWHKQDIIRPRQSTAGSLTVLRAADRPFMHLIHPGGGGTAVYRTLAAYLPQDWTVTASDDIGRGDTVGALASTYLRDVLARGGVPDIIGGWSLGGLVAFQMARLLVAGGRPSPILVLLDAPPPGTAGDLPDDPIINLELAGLFWRSLGLVEHGYPLALDTGDDESAMRMLAVALHEAGEPVEVDLLLDRLDVYRRHRRALTSYSPPMPLAAQALVITAALGESAVDGWRRLLLSEPSVARVDVGHYELLGSETARDVANMITQLVRP
jgi:thioesterase domain-containing protein